MAHSKDERVLFLLDSFLEGKGYSGTETIQPEAAAMDYVKSYLDEPDQAERPADKAIRSRTEELLGAFLDSGPSNTLTPANDAVDMADTADADDMNAKLDDAYYTETLARIYLKQHRYTKALEIIRSLYLNFPNKSIYFADQIRYLEKLVRIN